VRETVVVVAVVGMLVFAGTEVCVCADATVAAQRIRAREMFFTGFSIWGRSEIYLIFSIFVDTPRNEKNKKG